VDLPSLFEAFDLLGYIMLFSSRTVSGREKKTRGWIWELDLKREIREK
jgi:hypothetical protein